MANLAMNNQLIQAILKEDYSEVCSIVKKGANVNFIDSSRNTPLHFAANRNLDIVKFLVSKGANIEAIDEDGRTPLMSSSYSGKLYIVQYLLEKGADIDIYDPCGWTSLYYAVCHGYYEICKCLVEKGANLNVYLLGGDTLLSLSIILGHTDIAQLLINLEADVNICNKDSWGPLHYAAKSADFQITKSLIDRGANLDGCTSEGETPLSISLQQENEDIVQLLLTSGADTNKIIKNLPAYLDKIVAEGNLKIAEILLDNHNNNHELLIHSVKNNKIDVVAFLLTREVNVNEPDTNNETPLSCAVKNKNLQMIESLLNNGAEFSIHTAFLDAIVEGEKDVIRLLIKKGANVNQQYKNGSTPLLRAIEENNLYVMEMLIENGAKVNLVGKTGITPLQKAVEKQKFNIGKILVSKGANVKDQHHLLMTSIERKNTDLVELLIQNGVELNVVYDNGYTALTKALQMKLYIIGKMLVEKGANVNQVDQHQNHPLLLVASNFNMKLFDYFVKCGGDIEEVEEKLNEIADKNENFAIYLEKTKDEKMGIKKEKNVSGKNEFKGQEQEP